jgi:hypothetical protein
VTIITHFSDAFNDFVFSQRKNPAASGGVLLKSHRAIRPALVALGAGWGELPVEYAQAETKGGPPVVNDDYGPMSAQTT